MSTQFNDSMFNDSELLVSAFDMQAKSMEREIRKNNTAVYEISTSHVPAYVRTFQKIFRFTADNGTQVFKFSYFYWDSRTQKTWEKTENDNRLRNLPTIARFGSNLSPANSKGEKNSNFVNVKLFDLAVKSAKHATLNKLFGKSSVPTADKALKIALESDASWLD